MIDVAVRQRERRPTCRAPIVLLDIEGQKISLVQPVTAEPGFVPELVLVLSAVGFLLGI
jgi:hypothetical protein